MNGVTCSQTTSGKIGSELKDKENTMENIIKKAIEGGYDCNLEKWKSLEYWQGVAIVLDPLFWQAIGKSCGWDELEDGRDWDSKRFGFMPVWKHHALRFHEINLTQGWDAAVKYLEEELSTPSADRKEVEE